MHLTERQHIDAKAWDKLVSDNGGTVFSLSTYLDSVAANWAVLYNEEKTGGIVCPYTLKLGVKVLYAPFFHRYIEWIGTDRPEPEKLLEQLKLHFKVADAQIWYRGKMPFKKRFHQQITAEKLKKNQQVKRMLKKAQCFEVVEEMDRGRLLALLKTELTDRVAGIHDHSLSLLKKLVTSFDFPDIVQLNLTEEGEWKGALWLLPFNDRLLYLKGTVTKDAKEKGGMYRLMNEAMELAFSNDAVFDFGGSNAGGVRRFNRNWGGEDRFYYHLQWNNAPLWWKFIKSVRSLWKRK